MSSFPSIACVILAAGMGTRMRSDRPKVLHALAHEPMLAHVCRAAAGLELERGVIVAGPEMREPPPLPGTWQMVTQHDRRGTADAVRQARSALEGFAGPVLVLFGDTPLISRSTIERLVGALDGPGKPALSVLGMRPVDPGRYGRLVQDESGGLTKIVEFADASDAEREITLCNAGLKAFDGVRLFELLDTIDDNNAQGEFYLTDAVAVARSKGYAVAVAEAPEEEVMGINSRRDLAQAEAALQQRLRDAALEGGVTLSDPATTYLSADTKFGRDVEIGPCVQIGPGTTIGDGVVIRAFSHIEGATIGDGAIIGPFARLRPGAELGKDVHIGNFVEAKNVTMGDGAKANHLTYLGDASIGSKTNVGAGTITCNYDGSRKHHTEIGADVSIGSNTAFVAPVTIGDESLIAAGSVITEDVEPGALALGRSSQTSKSGTGRRIKQRNAAAKAAELAAKKE
ncbi:MAG: bifunctional UDP-N-acetylglucosamine diphosphorylase/glucosamine-1-phosphate N-acetyltransferase GlmU [Pseudomonadota bacterium]